MHGVIREINQTENPAKQVDLSELRYGIQDHQPLPGFQLLFKASESYFHQDRIGQELLDLVSNALVQYCELFTSDADDEEDRVDHGIRPTVYTKLVVREHGGQRHHSKIHNPNLDMVTTHNQHLPHP